MSAKVTCKEELKESVKQFLEPRLEESIDNFLSDDEGIEFIDEEDGVSVIFPNGEIYGFTNDYVYDVATIFQLLKTEFPEVAIEGICYEYETISYMTYGYHFYCTAEENEINMNDCDWQECASCGKIVEGNTFYNSSGYDDEYGEGNLMCLCCPTCALDYIINGGIDVVEGNDEWPEDAFGSLYEMEDIDEAVNEFILSNIKANIDLFMENFRENKERILSLAAQDNLPEEIKETLTQIIEKM